MNELASGDPTCAANIATRPSHATETLNSIILLPVLPKLPVIGQEPKCGERIGLPCFTPQLDLPGGP